MKQAIANIRTEIKKQMAESAKCRECIRTTTGMDRYWAWVDKRDVGDRTRYLYLALAALRGRAYGSVEHKCREGNEPSAGRLHGTLVEMLGQEAAVAAGWTKDKAKAWLTRPKAAEANVEAA